MDTDRVEFIGARSIHERRARPSIYRRVFSLTPSDLPRGADLQVIFKHGMEVPGLKPYVRRGRLVMAKRMTDDFMVESGKGWDQGRRGDWLVQVEGDIWHAIEDAQFRRVYREPLPTDCVGPCDAASSFPPDRRNGVDRRATS